MKKHLKYHHLAIPTTVPREGEVYLEEFKVYVVGYDTNPYGVEWMRFELDSPLPELVKTIPHIAFEVDDLAAEIEGKDVLIEPNSPSEGVTVAFIVHNGSPIEFLQYDKRREKEEMVLEKLTDEIVDFYTNLPQHPVMKKVTPGEIRNHLAVNYDFSNPIPLDHVMDDVSQMMREWIVQTTHPRYFGLFNPTSTLASITADTFVALYNPQLAAWSHAPAANEIEQFVLKYLMGYFGFEPSSSHAAFTTGGAEANLSAVLAALTHRFPNYDEHGLAQALSAQPRIYLSAEAHDSFVKIAHITGLGRKSLQVIPVDDQLKMDMNALSVQYNKDKAAGYLPFLVVGTAGTTGAGIIDPLPELRDFCQSHGLWFHVDAAWGGAAVLSTRLRKYLQGIEGADSITFDAHKWLSVPMGAGMFFCKHNETVLKTFRVSTAYMPGKTSDTIDPYVSTIQWSRRFIGLKVFMTLAELGIHNLAARIEHQTAMGELLRQKLRESGWKILNETPLPLVCFTHPELNSQELSALLQQLYKEQNVWISEVYLNKQIHALRACITSFRTQEEDIVFLVKALKGAASHKL
ncbi:MAG: aminotransferase class V-fold PLP-dependent enzyme [Candidatus Aminicenantes bacterium]|nr:aminotransferase class V-fold PLP-dependent enzyme [Candidatus Aminicenantes bacterium]NIM77626.1 aminotransferase class V-fold PLP-dependent enzyme [Candidatus Aminicenantes bacterium]NIN16938.1 aminotransferase class V-fold PLP-dependent enzyme [Candidatus Aminicenantes bacterium]NIN40831.1 aminotransferase class V-fold PLP-dependent enzyme [Candidatus Aminicenantes bacterium]NIN83635.1 aminotransferase class V-fold PLP-dependent enzyme [Candidatus Aminicenantes bacterium]